MSSASGTPATVEAAPLATASVRQDEQPVRRDEQEKARIRALNLARIGWLGIVVACLIAVVILLLQDYYGYAAVTLAVAASAAINLR